MATFQEKLSDAQAISGRTSAPVVDTTNADAINNLSSIADGVGSLFQGNDEKILNRFTRELEAIDTASRQDGATIDVASKRRDTLKRYVTDHPELFDEFKNRDQSRFGNSAFLIEQKQRQSELERQETLETSVVTEGIKKFGEQVVVRNSDGSVDFDSTFDLVTKQREIENTMTRMSSEGNQELKGRAAIKYAYDTVDTALGMHVNNILSVIGEAKALGVEEQQMTKDLADQFAIAAGSIKNQVSRDLYAQGYTKEQVDNAVAVVDNMSNQVLDLTDTTFFESAALKAKQLSDNADISMFESMPMLAQLNNLGVGERVFDQIVEERSFTDSKGFRQQLTSELNAVINSNPRAVITDTQNLIGLISEDTFDFDNLSRKEREKAVSNGVSALNSLLSNTTQSEQSKEALKTLSANLLRSTGKVTSAEDLSNASSVFNSNWMQGFKRLEQDSRYAADTEIIADSARNLHVQNIQSAGSVIRRLTQDGINEVVYNREVGKFEVKAIIQEYEVPTELDGKLVGASSSIAQTTYIEPSPYQEELNKQVKRLNNSLAMINNLSGYDQGLKQFNNKQQRELVASQAGTAMTGKSNFPEDETKPSWRQATEKGIEDDQLLNFNEVVQDYRTRLLNVSNRLGNAQIQTIQGLPEQEVLNLNSPNTTDEIGELIRRDEVDRIEQANDSIASNILPKATQVGERVFSQEEQELTGEQQNVNRRRQITTKKVIEAEEGVRLKSYKDKLGFKTIGTGFNMDQTGAKKLWKEAGVSVSFDDAYNGTPISEEDSAKLFELTYNKVREQANDVVSNYTDLSPNRQAVIDSLIFQMGVTGAKKFKKFREAVERGDWERAAEELLDSKFARTDAPNRARRAAEMIRGDLSLEEAEEMLVSLGLIPETERAV
jgi:lysozyme